MTNDDFSLGDLLELLPTPDHAPGFWPDLDAHLGADDGLGADHGAADTAAGLGDVDTDLDHPAVDELARRRRARRWIIASAAAAAAVLAVVIGLSTVDDDEDPPVITDTTTTTSTTVPPDEDAAPARTAEIPVPLAWSRSTSNLTGLGGLDGLDVVAAPAGGLFALGNEFGPDDLEPRLDGLIRADDGLTWEPVSTDAMRIGDAVPSWFPDGDTEFEPIGVERGSRRIHVVEATTRGELAPRVRIWSSDTGDDWVLAEIDSGVDDPGLTTAVTLSPRVSVADAGDRTLVSLRWDYEFDWWAFVPGGDPGLPGDPRGWPWLPSATPAPEGIVVMNPPEAIETASGAEYVPLDQEPETITIAWDDLPPEALETWKFSVANFVAEESSRQLYVVEPDGAVTQVEDPRPEGAGAIRWSGTRFYSGTFDTAAGGFRVLVSDDGSRWESVAELPPSAQFLGMIDDVFVAERGPDLVVSTDLGLTFEPVVFDELPPAVIEEQSDDGMSWSSEWSFLDTTVQSGAIISLVFRLDTSEWFLVRTTNGIDWDLSTIDSLRDGGGGSARRLALTPDGTAFVYTPDGRVHVGSPADE